MSRDDDREEEQPGEARQWSQDNDLFDSDGALDDPDRDTDFAAVYHEDEPEQEPSYFDDPADDEPWSPEYDRDELASPGLVDDDDWDTGSEDELQTPARGTLPPLGAYTAMADATAAEHTADDPDDYEDDDSYEGDDGYEDDVPYEEDYEDVDDEPTIPLGLIIVGLVALVLLGAGGYGVMQQRAALQEEVRQLQTRLATAASPAEVAKTRAASGVLQQRNDELEARVVTLERENRTLQATVAGLERQLSAQQEALQKTPPTKPEPAAAPAPRPATQPAPKPVAKPAPRPVQRDATPTASTAPAGGGDWFVNFGSYGQEQDARRWAERLEPEAGSVIVMAGEKDGRTFYRVRVVGLASRDAANATARALERKYGLDKLWVGESG